MVRVLLAPLPGLALLLAGAPAGAQNLASPAPHWGGLMYPETAPTRQLGFQTLLFSEFGQPGDGVYSEAYRESIGLNLFSASSTRNLSRTSLAANSLLLRSTAFVGWSGDEPTRSLQNHFIHRCGGISRIRCPGGQQIPYVPRGRVRRAVEVGYGGELNLQLLSLTRPETGDLRLFKTPLFVGAGVTLSTILSELYTQLGFLRFPLVGFGLHRLEPWFFLYSSGMARAGLAAAGLPIPWLQEGAFQRVAPYHVTVQGSIGVMLLRDYFPVSFEVGITATSGIFVEGGGRPLPEKLIAWRLAVGDLTFETFNDLINQKDKGPTFGVRVFLDATPGGLVNRFLSWL